MGAKEMTRITADAELRKKLLNFTEDLEICDENGFVIAKLRRFTPESDPEHWEELTPPMSEEEFREALNSTEPGVTTQELKAYLRSL
jgi:hypothetical protein